MLGTDMFRDKDTFRTFLNQFAEWSPNDFSPTWENQKSIIVGHIIVQKMKFSNTFF